MNRKIEKRVETNTPCYQATWKAQIFAAKRSKGDEKPRQGKARERSGKAELPKALGFLRALRQKDVGG